MEKKFLLYIMIILFFFLYSCSNENENTPTSPYEFEVQKVSSSINRNEIGGEGLKVISVFKDSTPVQGESYTTLVSKVGTQLLLITDFSGNVRGLTLSFVNDNGVTILPCDATSTAFSLLLLSPGILTTKPDETLLRFEQFNQLNSFRDLVAYLRGKLFNNSLLEIISTVDYQNLFSNVITEYNEKFISFFDKSKKNTIQSFSYFDVHRNSSGDIVLSNKSFRFVNVYRRDLDNQNQELQITTVVRPMEGVVPLSWGSLITSTYGKSVDTVDLTYSPSPSIAKSEYWVVGPGLKQTSVTLPNSIPSDNSDAVALTYTFYLVLPLIDIVTGGISMLSIVNAKGSPAYVDLIKIIRSVAPPLVKNKPMSPTETLNFIITMSSILATKFLPLPLSAPFSLIMNSFSTFFGLINIKLFVSHLEQIEPILKFDITNSQQTFKPKIYSISPPYANPGDTVQILGVNFGNGKCANCEVYFNNTIAFALPNFWNDTLIKVVVPQIGVVGKVKVYILVNGLFSNYYDFYINQPKLVQSLCGFLVPDMFSLGQTLDGNLAHGAEGDFSCSSDIYPNGLRISSSFLPLEGLVYFDFHCIPSTNFVTVELRWVDNAFFNGKKALKLFNWNTRTWEEVAIWDGNDGLEHLSNFYVNCRSDFIDNTGRLRLGIWASGFAVIHLASVKVQ